MNDDPPMEMVEECPFRPICRQQKSLRCRRSDVVSGGFDRLMTDDWRAVTTTNLFCTQRIFNWTLLASGHPLGPLEVEELRVVVLSCDGDGALSFTRCQPQGGDGRDGDVEGMVARGAVVGGQQLAGPNRPRIEGVSPNSIVYLIRANSRILVLIQ